LSAGKHTVFVRARDAAGNWGVVGGVVFNLPKTGPQTTSGSATPTPANGTQDVAISATGDDSNAGGTIDRAEYFVDTAPALGSGGSGVAMALNRSAAVVSEDVNIPAASVLGLGEGLHHVFVHSHDSLGLWGPPLDIPLSVDLTGPGVDGADVAPNPTNGVLTSLAHPGYLVVSATITDASSGGLPNAVTDAEGFLDTVGATGTGFQLAAVDGAMDSSTESVYGLIPISQIRALTNGTHHVSVRGQDAAGNWGTTYTMNLVVDKVAPVLGAVVGSPNPTNGAASLAPDGARQRDDHRGRRVLARHHRPRRRQGHQRGVQHRGRQPRGHRATGRDPLWSTAVQPPGQGPRRQLEQGGQHDRHRPPERHLLQRVHLGHVPVRVVHQHRRAIGQGGGGHPRRRHEPRHAGDLGRQQHQRGALRDRQLAHR